MCEQKYRNIENIKITKPACSCENRVTGTPSQLVYVCMCARMNSHFCGHNYEGCVLNFDSVNQSAFCKCTAQSVYAIKCVCWFCCFSFPFLDSAPQSRNAFTFYCSVNLWVASCVCLQLFYKS